MPLRPQFTRMLHNAMKMAGEDFEIIRNEERRTIKGIKHIHKETQRNYISFYPDTDIKTGDRVIRKVSGDEWVIIEIDFEMVDGEVFSVDAYYETNFERGKLQPQAINYTFHNSSNIIAGSQSAATMNINIVKIEAEIEEKGGSDKEGLLAMVVEIKQAFEKQDALPKGSLSRFSEMLERHSWITGSLVQLLGSAAIQFLIK